METYAGGVFSRTIEGGRAGASIHVTERKLIGETQSGERFELDPQRCGLQLGGTSGRMWFCRAEDGSVTLFSEQEGFVQALRQVPALRLQVEQILEQQHSQRHRTGLLVLGGLLSLALLAVGGYYLLRGAGRTAVMALPTSVDEKIGKLAIATMDLGGPVVDDPVVQQGVERIVKRLGDRAKGDFDYHVQVVDAPVMNAFALPGGEIVVYTGLLKRADSADAVAGILAHEISHVTGRHGLQRIAQSVGIAASVQLFLGDVSGLAALGVELLQSGALTSYGRDQEREADMDGLRLLHRAGIDPRSLAVVFKQLKKQAPEVPAGLAWLSTHPDLGERIRTVERTAQRMGPTAEKPLNVDFAAMRAALGSPLKGQTPKGDDNATETAKGDHGK